MSTTQVPDTTDRPGAIHARPVRHPGRWLAIAIIVIVLAMMVSSLVSNPRWDFPFMYRVMIYQPVIQGLLHGTILGTIGAMVLGIGLGIVIGIMRLSENPVLRGVSFAYTWFFRAIPRLVLLLLLGTGLGYLYPKFDIGYFPFSQQLADLLGFHADTTAFSIDVNAISSTLIMGILGLGLSEAAYMAEIARAGIQSVDRGQTEAAQALGMSRGKTMRRIVLPQAMRVIVPPTGNETIAMVKDTSLLFAGLSLIDELLFQTNTIGTRTLKIMPTMIAATAWYLIVCSVLMIGQFYLERYFGRGFGTKASKKQAKQVEAVTLREGAAAGGTGGM